MPVADGRAGARLLIRSSVSVARCAIGVSMIGLSRRRGGLGWTLAGEDVSGRLEWDPDGGPYRVVIDGRSLSWEEFGLTLGSFEGWRFRLVIEDRSADVRSDPAAWGGA